MLQCYLSQWWTKQLGLSFVALSWYVQPSILKPFLVISNNKTLYSLDKNGYFILFENHKKPQNLFTVKEIWVLWFKSLPQSSIGPNPSIQSIPFTIFLTPKNIEPLRAILSTPKILPHVFLSILIHSFFIQPKLDLFEFFKSSAAFSLQLIFSPEELFKKKVWVIPYDSLRTSMNNIND